MKLFTEILLQQGGCEEIVWQKTRGAYSASSIDTRVACPAEMHVRLRLLSHRRFWVVTKFADSHSHDLSSPDKVHHFYSHQTHRSKISRSIMTNLVDIGIRPSNISMLLMQWTTDKVVKKQARNKLLILFDIREITLVRSLFRSSNIFKKKVSLIQNFSLPVKLIMRAH